MRLLRTGPPWPLVLATAVLALALAATAAAGHGADSPAHGVDAETYHALWSGDVDDGDADALRDQPDRSAADMRALAAATDVPFDEPPAAVERWNRGDHREFPATDRGRSVGPPGAARRDGPYARDAYAAVFAVQPSTRAWLSPRERPLYVAPSGELLGTVDYRVHVPADDWSPNRSSTWRLRDHGITATRLLVDGRVVSTGPGTHTPRLPYALGGVDGRAHTLTLEADVRVAVTQRVSTCDRHVNGSCVDWDVSYRHRVDAMTVRESVTVESYDLDVSGARARYPDGDLGLVLYKNRPWLGYSVPGGDVRGVWRFYSARDERWDTLVTRTAGGTTESHSPMHPLYVHAYPIDTGPTASPRDAVTILETYGVRTAPPTLPANVHLDVLTEPYTASFGIVTRTASTAYDPRAVTAYGLVRGVTVDAADAAIDEVPIHESELALSLVEATAETVTVRVELRDAETGAPINTLAREGHVVLQGERVETDRSGTVTRTLPRPSGGVSARYEPGPWWLADTGYVGDSDVVYVRGTVLHALATLYELGVPVALFLFAAFVVDRLTGWRVWPPWRGL